jgi:hypothetical protein
MFYLIVYKDNVLSLCGKKNHKEISKCVEYFSIKKNQNPGKPRS